MAWDDAERFVTGGVIVGAAVYQVTPLVSAVVAITELVLWWFLIGDAADPSGPLQPA
jgi:hypothetical protein